MKMAIIEDAKNVRENLHEFFGSQQIASEVWSVESMEAFFQRIEDTGVKPDMILCDIGLPGMSGIEGIKKTKAMYPEMDIIMLTVFNDSDRIFKSLCAGASGYVLKGTPLLELLKAVIEIRDGGSYMSPSIARKVIDYFAPSKRNEEEILSPREKQIVQGLTEGLSYKLIADRLTMSIGTVRTHIKNIYKKLHVNSKTQVIYKVMKGEI